MRTAAMCPQRSWGGYLLGFALGGFFDGILLHQILQWHHLLTGVQTGALRSLRAQVMADGLFHLLMYFIALAGLWSLWRAHRASVPCSGRLLSAQILIGFAAWHFIDAVLSHWVLGIHRIKTDSANPLAWDLSWLLLFGVLPLIAGLWLKKRSSDGPAGSGRAVMVSFATVIVIAASWAARAPTGGNQVAVVIRPSDISRLLDGAAKARAGITWADRSGAIWVFTVGPEGDPAMLYRYGALLVTRSPLALGCLAWTRTA